MAASASLSHKYAEYKTTLSTSMLNTGITLVLTRYSSASLGNANVSMIYILVPCPFEPEREREKFLRCLLFAEHAHYFVHTYVRTYIGTYLITSLVRRELHFALSDGPFTTLIREENKGRRE